MSARSNLPNGDLRAGIHLGASPLVGRSAHTCIISLYLYLLDNSWPGKDTGTAPTDTDKKTDTDTDTDDTSPYPGKETEC